MIHGLAAFLSGVAVDVLATMVFHYTNKNRAMMAANFNVVVIACSLFVFVDVAKDHALAIPYLIVIWVGGIVGVKLKVKLEKGNK
jgi:predicted membrane channel-forming protein YqfA (hemolysin III family)